MKTLNYEIALVGHVLVSSSPILIVAHTVYLVVDYVMKDNCPCGIFINSQKCLKLHSENTTSLLPDKGSQPPVQPSRWNQALFQVNRASAFERAFCSLQWQLQRSPPDPLILQLLSLVSHLSIFSPYTFSAELKRPSFSSCFFNSRLGLIKVIFLLMDSRLDLHLLPKRLFSSL